MGCMASLCNKDSPYDIMEAQGSNKNPSIREVLHQGKFVPHDPDVYEKATSRVEEKVHIEDLEVVKDEPSRSNVDSTSQKPLEGDSSLPWIEDPVDHAIPDPQSKDPSAAVAAEQLPQGSRLFPTDEMSESDLETATTSAPREFILRDDPSVKAETSAERTLSSSQETLESGRARTLSDGSYSIRSIEIPEFVVAHVFPSVKAETSSERTLASSQETLESGRARTLSDGSYSIRSREIPEFVIAHVFPPEPSIVEARKRLEGDTRLVQETNKTGEFERNGDTVLGQTNYQFSNDTKPGTLSFEKTLPMNLFILDTPPPVSQTTESVDNSVQSRLIQSSEQMTDSDSLTRNDLFDLWTMERNESGFSNIIQTVQSTDQSELGSEGSTLGSTDPLPSDDRELEINAIQPPESEKKEQTETSEGEDLHQAATKIQANFRGYCVRKEMNSRQKQDIKEDVGTPGVEAGESLYTPGDEKENKSSDPASEEDRQLNEAATKIQANFRGYIVRKEMTKKIESEPGMGNGDLSETDAVNSTTKEQIIDLAEKSAAEEENISFVAQESITKVETESLPNQSVENKEILTTQSSDELQREESSPSEKQNNEQLIISESESQREGVIIASESPEQLQKETVECSGDQTSNIAELPQLQDNYVQQLEEEALNVAATKIQANYRGYRVRKEKASVAAKAENNDDDETNRPTNEEKGEENTIVLESTEPAINIEGNKDEKTDMQMNTAATKIQAGFRGYKVRKEMKKTDDMKGTEQITESMKEEIEIDKPDIISDVSETPSDVKDLDLAATKIQANFRGYKVRKEMKTSNVNIRQEVAEYPSETEQKDENKVDISLDTALEEIDNKQANDAATKIQANFRGYKVRKNMLPLPSKKNETDDEKSVTEPISEEIKESVNEDVVDPSAEEKRVNEAATKIQANFKGYKVRKDMKIAKENAVSAVIDDSGIPAAEIEQNEIEIVEVNTPLENTNIKERRIDIVGDDRFAAEEAQMNEAATKIQANFRGYKVRKEFAAKQPEVEIMSSSLVAAEIPSERIESSVQNGVETLTDFEKEFPADDKELNEAATKLQANFRGFKARKEKVITENEDFADSPAIQSVLIDTEALIEIPKEDISADDKDLNTAATKIQANFRGYKVRKELKVSQQPMEVPLETIDNEIQNDIISESEIPEDTNNNKNLDSVSQELSNDELLNNSATKIQANFRGYKVRKDMKTQKSKATSTETEVDKSDIPQDINLELEFPSDDKELNEAATKLQANFRGFKARKEMEASPLLKDEESTDITLKENELIVANQEITEISLVEISNINLEGTSIEHSDLKEKISEQAESKEVSELKEVISEQSDLIDLAQEFPADDKELNDAATKLQANFRGFKARKEMEVPAVPTGEESKDITLQGNELVVEIQEISEISQAEENITEQSDLKETISEQSDLIDLAQEFPADDKELNDAATKLQANFRGFKARKEMEVPAVPTGEESKDITLQENKLVVEIQEISEISQAEENITEQSDLKETISEQSDLNSSEQSESKEVSELKAITSEQSDLIDLAQEFPSDDKELNEAATKLQANFRGFKARKEMEMPAIPTGEESKDIILQENKLVVEIQEISEIPLAKENITEQSDLKETISEQSDLIDLAQEFPADDKELNDAATKLQANFRNFKARKEVEVPAVPTGEESKDITLEEKKLVVEIQEISESPLAEENITEQSDLKETISEQSELKEITSEQSDLIDLAQEFPSDDKELNEAATKLQANFRGFKARKEMDSSAAPADKESKTIPMEENALIIENQEISKTEDITLLEIPNNNNLEEKISEQPELKELTSEQSDLVDLAEEFPSDDKELNEAATKLQANFRGFKARKEIEASVIPKEESKVIALEENELVVENQDITQISLVEVNNINLEETSPEQFDLKKTILEQSDVIDLAQEFPADDKELNDAATKLQANFRGFKARKEIEVSAIPTGEESKDITLQENELVVEIQEKSAIPLAEENITEQSNLKETNSEQSELKEINSEQSDLIDLAQEFPADDKELNEAATKLQANFRGFKARKEMEVPAVPTGEELKDITLQEKKLVVEIQDISQIPLAEENITEQSDLKETISEQSDVIDLAQEFPADDKELNEAAKKLQANFRGFKARKEMEVPAVPTGEELKDITLQGNELVVEIQDISQISLAEENITEQSDLKETISEQSDVIDLAQEFPADDKELNEAATKLQANFRGFKARKEMEVSAVPIGEELKDITLQGNELVVEKQEISEISLAEANIIEQSDLKETNSEQSDLKEIVSEQSNLTDLAQEFPSDDKELNEAATKLQANFRGFKARKEMVPVTPAENESKNIPTEGNALLLENQEISETEEVPLAELNNVNLEEISSEQSDIIDLAQEFPSDDKELNEAATKLQANFRGFKARKEMEVSVIPTGKELEAISVEENPLVVQNQEILEAGDISLVENNINLKENIREQSDLNDATLEQSELIDLTQEFPADDKELNDAATKLQANFRGFKARKEMDAFATPAEKELKTTPIEDNTLITENQEISKAEDISLTEIKNNINLEEKISEQSDLVDLAQEFPSDDKELNEAATKLQANFRGFKARKEMETSVIPALEESKSIIENQEEILEIGNISLGEINTSNLEEKTSEQFDLSDKVSLQSNLIDLSEEFPIDDKDLNEAATKLQANFRGFKARKEILSQSTADNIVETASELSSIIKETEANLKENISDLQLSENREQTDKASVPDTEDEGKSNAEVEESSVANEIPEKPTELSDVDLEQQSSKTDEFKEKEVSLNIKIDEIQPPALTDPITEFETEFPLDDEELNAAATKLQANFRGFQIRKEMKEKSPLEVQEESSVIKPVTENQFNEMITKINDDIHETQMLVSDFEKEFPSDDKELNEAATKLQANFRGFVARKEAAVVSNTGEKSDKEISPRSEIPVIADNKMAEDYDDDNDVVMETDLLDFDQEFPSNDEQLNEAATKLQANFRGFKTRKEMSTLKSETEVPLESDSVSTNQSEDTIQTVVFNENALPEGNDTQNDKGEDFIALDFEIDENLQNEAATKIQANFRGFQVRRKLGESQTMKKAKEKKTDSKSDEDLGTNTASEDSSLPQTVENVIQVLQPKEGEELDRSIMEQEFPTDDEELNLAATKLQANFRGYKARKDINTLVGSNGRQSTDEVVAEGSLSATDVENETKIETLGTENAGINSELEQLIELESEFPSDDADLNLAATKLQANFRGFKARKDLLSSQSTPADLLVATEGDAVSKEGESKSDLEKEFSLDDPEMNEAASKLQAEFRHFKEGKTTEGNISQIESDENKSKTPESTQIIAKDENMLTDEVSQTASQDPTTATSGSGKVSEEASNKAGEEGITSSEESIRTEDEIQMNRAATKIQASFRGYKVRKNMNSLDTDTTDINGGIECPGTESLLLEFGEKVLTEPNIIAKPLENIEEKSEDSNGDDKQMNDAATKIQANFRGYQVRKSMKSSASKADNEEPDEATPNIDLEPEDNNRDGAVESEDSSQDTFYISADQQMNEAATKIQANFRGYQVRKSKKPSEVRKNKDEGENQTGEMPINATSPENSDSIATENNSDKDDRQMNEAATKIQANFRGYKTRKDMAALHPKSMTTSEISNANPERDERETESTIVGKPLDISTEENTTDKEDGKDLNVAATKIQANFRGYKVRKEMKLQQPIKDATSEVDPVIMEVSNEETLEGVVPENITEIPEDLQEISLDDKDLNSAATKIQANFRGYKVRKDMKTHQSTKGDVETDIHKSANAAVESINETNIAGEDTSGPPGEEKQMNEAATKIQANFRGYKVRKDMKASTLTSESEVGSPRENTELEFPSDTNIITETFPTEDESKISDLQPTSVSDMDESTQLNEAAVKIQAGFRGYKVRKNLKETNEMKEGITKEPVGVSENELAKGDQPETDSRTDDQQMSIAATKIQANYRGYRTRKDLQGKKEAHKQNDDDEAMSFCSVTSSDARKPTVLEPEAEMFTEQIDSLEERPVLRRFELGEVSGATSPDSLEVTTPRVRTLYTPDSLSPRVEDDSLHERLSVQLKNERPLLEASPEPPQAIESKIQVLRTLLGDEDSEDENRSTKQNGIEHKKPDQ